MTSTEKRTAIGSKETLRPKKKCKTYEHMELYGVSGRRENVRSKWSFETATPCASRTTSWGETHQGPRGLGMVCPDSSLCLGLYMLF